MPSSARGATSGPLPLSVCLIARDEASNLPGLMASLEGLAEEVVVVDTGSSDGTPALAAALGARVLHTPWREDFAEARNVALGAARAPWILTMDADQVLDAAARPALSAALLRTDCLAQLVTIRLLGSPRADGREHVVRQLPSLRLVRRDPRIRYRGRVHEDVSHSLHELGCTRWPDSGVTLTDHGYVQAEARQRKLARNLALLRLAHAEAPAELHTAYKLATSLPAEAGPERAQVLERALREACAQPAQELRALACLPRLAAGALGELVGQGRLAEAAEAARALLGCAPAALHFTAGRVLARAGSFEEARAALQAYLEAAGPTGRRGDSTLWLEDESAHPAEACRWLAWMSRYEGRLEESWGWIRRGLSTSAQAPCWPLEAQAVDTLCARGQTAQAADVLHRMGQRASAGASSSGSVPRTPQADPLARALPELMAASARLAQAGGDLQAAREFAQQATAAADDAATVLLAQLDIEAGRTDHATLSGHHRAILGQRFDTLALKLTIGAHLGQPWPYPVPPAAQALCAPPG